MNRNRGIRFLALVMSLCMFVNMTGLEATIAWAETTMTDIATEAPSKTEAPSAGPEATAADPEETVKPEATEDPGATSAPESTGEPEATDAPETLFGDANGDGSVNAEDLRQLLTQGYTLERAGTVMPISLPEREVNNRCFEAELWHGTEKELLTYAGLMALAESGWRGIPTGVQCDAALRYNITDYPSVPGYQLDALLYNDAYVTTLVVVAIEDADGAVEEVLYLDTIEITANQQQVRSWELLDMDARLTIRYVAEPAETEAPTETEAPAATSIPDITLVPPLVPAPTLPGGFVVPVETATPEVSDIPSLDTDPSSDEESGLTDEELQAEIDALLRQVEAQHNSGIMPLRFISDYVPSKYFELQGLPDEEWAVIPDDWQFETTETITQASVPSFEEYEYHFVNITEEDTPVQSIGVLRLSNGERRYYYTTIRSSSTTTGENRISATILNDNVRFAINYAIEEFHIDYVVKVKQLVNRDHGEADGWKRTVVIGEPSEDDGDVDYADSVTDENNNPITLDSIFGAKRPTTTTNRAYAFDVTIPYGYTAEITRVSEGGGTDTLIDNLGEEPYPHYVGMSENVTVQYTHKNDNVNSNRKMIVTLTQQKAPTFDAQAWLAYKKANGRGTTAKANDVSYDPSKNENGGNLSTSMLDDSGSWNWNTSTFASEEKTMEKQSDGTYQFIWTFQTNDPGTNYVLDALAFNGGYMKVPFYPLWEGGNPVTSAYDGKPEYGVTYTEMTLPDGGKVRLDYLREFNDSKQRVYRVTITGARSNVTVTGGNLMMYKGGAAEFTVFEIEGVEAENGNVIEWWNGDWEGAILADPAVYGEKKLFFGGDSSNKSANIRFKLKEGYWKPSYRYEGQIVLGDIQGSNTVLAMSEAGDKLAANMIYEADDGWYYLRIEENNQTTKMSTLSIIAREIKYTGQYSQGNVEPVIDIPVGSGTYYNYGDTVVIPDMIPVHDLPDDGTRDDIMDFVEWVVVDAYGDPVTDADGNMVTISPGQGLRIADVSDYAILDETLGSANQDVFVVHLQATWAQRPKKLTYYVFVYCDESAPELVDTIVVDRNMATGDDVLAGINFDAPAFAEWLVEHPYYHFATDKTVVETETSTVRDQGTILVHMVPTNGAVAVNKDVRNDKCLNDVFTYTIEATRRVDSSLPDITALTDTYLGYRKRYNDSATAANSFSVSLTKGRGGVFTLKAGERAEIYLPGGYEYTITESSETKNDDIYKTDIIYDPNGENGQRKEYPSVSKITVPLTIKEMYREVTFVNTLEDNPNVNITKTQVSPPNGGNVNPGGTITYAITVTNADPERRAHEIVVTDVLPSGDTENAELIYGGNDREAEADYDDNTRTITWNAGILGAGEKKTLTVWATVPGTVKTATIWQNKATLDYDNMPSDRRGKPDLTTAPVTAQFTPGTLTISKNLRGQEAEKEKDREFVFTVQVGTGMTGPRDATHIDADGNVTRRMSVMFAGGEATVRLKHGESIIIEGTAQEEYTVTEQLNEDDEYTVYVNGNLSAKHIATGSFDLAAGVSAAFVNEKLKPIDLEIVKTQAVGGGKPKTDQIDVKTNDIVEYTITVKNVGDVEAKDVKIVDAIPVGTELVADSISDDGELEGDTITWTADIPVDGRKTFSFQVKVGTLTQDEIPNTAHVLYTDGAGKPVDRSSGVVANYFSGALKITKIVEGATEEFVADMLFDIEVQLTYAGNRSYPYKIYDSDGKTDDVEQWITNGKIIQLKDRQYALITGLPEDAEYSVTEPGVKGFVSSAATPIWGFIAVGVPNEVEVFNTRNATDSVELTKTQQKNDEEPTTEPISVEARDVITYAITVVNTDAEGTPAFGVKVTDTVPEGLTLVDGSISDNGIEENGIITWNLDDVEPGKNVTVTFQVQAPITDKITPCTNQAKMTYENPTANQSDKRESNKVVATITPYSLTVRKEVDWQDITQNRNAEFEFTVKVDGVWDGGAYPVTGDTSEESMTFDNGEVQFTLRDKESITIQGLPANASYTVVEKEHSGIMDDEGVLRPFVVYQKDAAGNMTKLENRTATGELTNEDTTVTFVNMVKAGAELTIAKTQAVNGGGATTAEVTVQPDDRIEYTITVRNVGEAPAEQVVITDQIPEGLESAEIKSAKIQGVSADPLPQIEDGVITWNVGTLAENEEAVLTFEATVPQGVAYISWTNTATFERYEQQMKITGSSEPVVAKLQTYTLTLKKIVDDDTSQINRSFEFTVTASAGELTLTNYRDDTSTFTGSITTTLANGQEARISGIPLGATYSVAETANPSYKTWYTLREQKNDGSEQKKDGDGVATGEQEMTGDVTIEYTNTRISTLTISETVRAAEAYPVYLERPFTFDVRFTTSDAAFVPSYTLTHADGAGETATLSELTKDEEETGIYVLAGTLKLKHGETALFEVPADTDYEVEERTEDNADFMLFSSSGTSGTVAAGGAQTASFVNVPRPVMTKEQAKNDGALTTDSIDVEPGDTVTYRITVTNPSDMELNVTVRDEYDSKAAYVSGSASSESGSDSNGTMVWSGDILAPGEVRTYTFTVLYEEKPGIASDTFVNIATAMAFDSGTATSIPVDNSNSVTLTFTITPELTGSKTLTNKGKGADGAFRAGETAEFDIVVENAGNVTLNNVVVTEKLNGATIVAGTGYKVVNGRAVIAKMAPGEKFTVKARYTLSQADIDSADMLVNTATAASDETAPVTVTENVPKEARLPGMSIQKYEETIKPLGDQEFAVGVEIEYHILVRNTGNVTLTDVKVTDALVGKTGDQAWMIDTLAPGDIREFTATYTVTQKDVDNNTIVNTAVAQAADPTDREGSLMVTASAKSPGKANPALALRKTSGLDADVKAAYGETIRYVIEAENMGNVTLRDVRVDDPLTGDAWTIDVLSPGYTVQFETEYVVTEADLRAGHVTNVVTAKALNPQYDSSDPDSIEFVPVKPAQAVNLTEASHAHLTVEKKETSQPKSGNAYRSGETITYRITATNDGNQTVTDITVVDELTGDRWTISELAPGESGTFMAEHKVTEAEASAGSVVNVATARGKSLDPKTPDVQAEPSRVTSPTQTDLQPESETVAQPASMGIGSVIRNASDCFD